MSFPPTYKLYLLVENDSELKKLYEEQIAYRQENKVTDSGFDLFLPEDESYTSGRHTLLDHRIRCKMVIVDGDREIPTGYTLHPRSSTFNKYNLLLANSTGIIDQDYRGPIKVSFFSPLMSLVSHIGMHVDKGTRLVQLCAPSYKYFEVELVDSLDETDRGEGGFGSTGVISFNSNLSSL